MAGASRKGRGAPGRRWPAAPLCVAGAVFRASRKGCGAPGRRWAAAPVRRSTWKLPEGFAARLVALSAWQAQYLESPEGRRWAAAPLCVAGAVLGASTRACGAPGRRWAAAPVCVAGAALRASTRACGPPGRRWAAAPVCVAGAILGTSRRACGASLVGRGSCLRGRRSTWSLQKGLRRAWSPLGRGSCLRGRRNTWSPERVLLLFAWQAQYLEPPDAASVCVAGAVLGVRMACGAPGRRWAAARVCVAGAVLGASRKACGAPHRAEPRLLSAWQAQYLEPPEGLAARLVAAGPRLLAGAVLGSFQKGLRRAWSPGPRLLRAWQAQYLEVPEGLAARRGACLRGRRSTWSLQKGLRRAWSPLGRGSCLRGRRSTWSAVLGVSIGDVDVLCVNCVRGSCTSRRCCVNRRCEHFVWMASWHAGLAPCRV